MAGSYIVNVPRLKGRENYDEWVGCLLLAELPERFMPMIIAIDVSETERSSVLAAKWENYKSNKGGSTSKNSNQHGRQILSNRSKSSGKGKESTVFSTFYMNSGPPEVSVKESSNSVGESCVSEEDDQHDDNSSDSSVYTSGEDNLHESLPSKVQVQEVQTTSIPIPAPECVKTKRLRKQPERYGFSNLCVSSSSPTSEEISVSEALEGSEKEQWRRAIAEKLQSFEDNDAWELVKNPSDVSMVKCRWVFVKKFDVDNNN